MEITRLREGLADNSRSYNFAVSLDQLSVGPAGKQHLSQTCDCSGYRTPNITVVTRVNHRAIRKFFFITSSNHPKIRQQYVDKLDSNKRSHNASNAVNQQVPLQQSRRAKGPVPHAAQSEWD